MGADCLEQPPEVRVALGAQADEPVPEDEPRFIAEQSVTCNPPSVAGTWRMMASRLASAMAACSYNRGTVPKCDYLFSCAHRAPHQVTAWIRPAISWGFSRLAK